MKVPILGPLFQKILQARFTRNLGVLLQSRVPLLLSLQVMGRLVDHKIFVQEISTAIQKIKEGSNISDAFDNSQILTSIVLGMVAAGETSDKVPEMITKTADVLERDIDSSIQKMTTLIEPLLIVFMGGMIVLIMVGILLPMYGLTQDIQF